MADGLFAWDVSRLRSKSVGRTVTVAPAEASPEVGGGWGRVPGKFPRLPMDRDPPRPLCRHVVHVVRIARVRARLRSSTLFIEAIENMRLTGSSERQLESPA